jgi:hypothetical protein
VQDTASGDVEFKNVFDSDESILSAELLSDWAIAWRSNILEPLIHLNNIAFLKDLTTLSAWISNSDSHSSKVVLRFEHESLFLRW